MPHSRWIYTFFLAVFLAVSCADDGLPAVQVLVLDEAGVPVKDAEVSLHLEKTDWAGYEAVIASALTGQDGKARLETMQRGRYFVNVRKWERNNRFSKRRTEHQLEPGSTVEEVFSIRPPTEWERILGGGEHLVWRLAPLMTPDGDPFLDYPVDTDMFIDGRWLDSNGRLGLWWFNEAETRIFYDYATSGAVVESRMISLTEDLFVAEIDFFGIRMRIEMYPV